MSLDLSEPLSERLGALSREQLQAALDRFGLGALVGAQAARNGLFGQNLFLSVEGAGGAEQWVFRGAPHWPWQFSKERYFAEGVQRRTNAAVPWPYHVERDEALFGWSYALMPRLPGVSPTVVKADVDDDEWCRLAHAVGAGLAELHGFTGPDSGEYDPETDGIRKEASFEAWWLRSVEGYRSRCLEIPDALDEEDLAYIDGLIEAHRPALRVGFVPCFVHHDFKEGNIHVERMEGAWRLSGVFDLMTGAMGDGEQDLSRMAASYGVWGRETAHAFLDGYRKRRPLRPGARDRFRLYMLLDRLWIWEYGRRNQVWFPTDARFRRFARGAIDLDGLLPDD